MLLILGPVAMRLWAEFLTANFGICHSASDIRDVTVREAYERYEEKQSKHVE